jgi:hypothetical protein
MVCLHNTPQQLDLLLHKSSMSILLILTHYRSIIKHSTLMLYITIVFTFLTYGVTLKSCCACKTPFLGAWEPQIQDIKRFTWEMKMDY